jgi:hypothetical protein
MAPWGLTEPVLRRVRNLTLKVLLSENGQPNEHEIACVNQFWAHLDVEMEGYPKNNNWSFGTTKSHNRNDRLDFFWS